MQYLTHSRDPRRLQPLVKYLIKEAEEVDFNGESSFEGALNLQSLLIETNTPFSFPSRWVHHFPQERTRVAFYALDGGFHQSNVARA